jgi:hypothetical protein
MAKKKKKGRCWQGYKPVPGKKAYSEDSCVKIGEKREKNTASKKLERRRKKV